MSRNHAVIDGHMIDSTLLNEPIVTGFDGVAPRASMIQGQIAGGVVQVAWSPSTACGFSIFCGSAEGKGILRASNTPNLLTCLLTYIHTYLLACLLAYL